MPETTLFRRRNLPHWHVKYKAYFVTFRLKGSLPEKVVNHYKLNYENFLSKQPDEAEILEYQRRHFKKIEKLLDYPKSGPLYLQDPKIAKLVMEALDWIEEKYHWRITSAVIMSNHVHLLIVDSELATNSLEKSLGVLKGYTAREANKILNRNGSFWMSENFDHWCRNVDKIESVKRYIRNNPVKAGLVMNSEGWPWLREVAGSSSSVS